VSKRFSIDIAAGGSIGGVAARCFNGSCLGNAPQMDISDWEINSMTWPNKNTSVVWLWFLGQLCNATCPHLFHYLFHSSALGVDAPGQCCGSHCAAQFSSRPEWDDVVVEMMSVWSKQDIHTKRTIPHLLSIGTHNLFQLSHDVRVHHISFWGDLRDLHQKIWQHQCVLWSKKQLPGLRDLSGITFKKIL